VRVKGWYILFLVAAVLQQVAIPQLPPLYDVNVKCI